MDGVSVASGVAGLITLALQLSGTIAEYASAVKDKPHAVAEFENELSILSEVLGQLSEVLSSDRLKSRQFDRNSVLQRAIIDCDRRMARISEKLRPKNGGRLSRALDRLKWPFEQKEVLQMVENLRRFTQTFQFALSIENCAILAQTSEEVSEQLKEKFDTVNKINDMLLQQGLNADETARKSAELDQMIKIIPTLLLQAEDIKEMTGAVRDLEQQEQERRKTEILDWLAPLTSLHKHLDIQARTAPGTGQWLLLHPDFIRWSRSESDQHDLLCVGGPGVGKTVMSSIVFDDLRGKYGNGESATAYFYCDYSEQRLQTPSHMARCLLRQLCTTCPRIPSTVVEFYQQTKHEIKDALWFRELMKVLLRVSATFDQCFFVIDALDETESKEQRIGILEVLDAIRASQARTRIFATTRPHVAGIENRFQDAAKIEIKAHPEDLQKFLSRRIDRHPDSEWIMDHALKDEILSRLSFHANGMFLLPALQIDFILDQVTKADVRRALGLLSKSLGDAFRSTLDRIAALSLQRKEVALKTLMLISHVRRPLAVAELQHAMAVRFDTTDVDKDDMISLRTILDSCCGLVEVDRESTNRDLATIRLVHFSLEEYLRDESHGLFADPHGTITRLCLKYLTYESSRSLAFKDLDHLAKALAELPFLMYAASEWGHHAKWAPLREYQDLAMALFTNTGSLLAVAKISNLQTPEFEKWKSKLWAWALSTNLGAGISLAATFGLTDLLHYLISSTVQPNLGARNQYGSTPLHEAAMNGYESTARVLIAHEASLMDTNNGKATPFYLAISFGHLNVAKMLLENNRAQLDKTCQNGFTALHKAVEIGSNEMVLFLIQSGALINVRTDKGETPLHIAARRGYTSIARSLVVAGALVDAESRERSRPIDLACTGGHVALVRFLLENSASLEHADFMEWTPLHRACRQGDSEVVSLLLQHGANIQARDRTKALPIHVAVRSGKLETVQILLEHNPHHRLTQLRATDKRSSTPLIIALYTGKFHVHKYLRRAEYEILGSGIDNHAPSLPLAMAIEAGSLSEVQQILETNPDLLTLPDSTGQTAVHIAFLEKRLAIAQHLIKLGASINSKGYHDWTPLHLAATIGSLELVDLALSHSANIHARTSSEQTALHKAASSHNVPTVIRLLECGSDPGSKNDRGMTPLHVAAHQNFIDGVRVLLQEQWRGHELVQMKDKSKNTPRDWAERSGHLELSSLLRLEEKRAKVLIRRQSSISNYIGSSSSLIRSDSNLLEVYPSHFHAASQSDRASPSPSPSSRSPGSSTPNLGLGSMPDAATSNRFDPTVAEREKRIARLALEFDSD